MCPVLLLVLVVMSGCGGTKASDISSIEDMKGKKIGVQIGTTGDIYVSDYEGDKEGTKIERYNKGNDAISSLKKSLLTKHNPKLFFTNSLDIILSLTDIIFSNKIPFSKHIF